MQLAVNNQECIYPDKYYSVSVWILWKFIVKGMNIEITDLIYYPINSCATQLKSATFGQWTYCTKRHTSMCALQQNLV